MHRWTPFRTVLEAFLLGQLVDNDLSTIFKPFFGSVWNGGIRLQLWHVPWLTNIDKPEKNGEKPYFQYFWTNLLELRSILTVAGLEQICWSIL